MILSGKEIQRHIGKEIIIEPFDQSRVNPNSYNLTLHNELLVYENHELDMKKLNPTKRITIPEEGLVLEPNRLYLAKLSHQQFALPKLRSSTKNSMRHSLRAPRQCSSPQTSRRWRTWAEASSLSMH